MLRPRAPHGIVTGIVIAVLSGGANLSVAGVLPELWAQAEPVVIEPVQEVVPPAPAGRGPAPVLRADPLAAPRCAGLTLTAVSQLDDDHASLASIRSARGSVTRGFKGSVEDRRVVYVGENPRLRRPAVWLTAGKALCQVVMGDAQKPVAPPPPSKSGELEVDRSVLETALAHPETLGARIDLSTLSGASGLRLQAVTPGKLLHRLGLRRGDRIESVNGFTLKDAEQAMRALATLARATHLTAVVVRDGARRTVDVSLR